MDKIYSVLAIGFIVIMILSLNGVIYYNKYYAEKEPCSALKLVGEGNIGGKFNLIDENNNFVSEREAIDKPSLIYFGYTFCPDVCPLDAVRNAEAVDLLYAKGFELKPIFVTIDPDRDTPEVLLDFTDAIHPEMLGLTGSAKQIKAISQAYKTYYRKQVSEDEYYLVDHSTYSYLVTPEKGFVDFFRRDESALKIAEKIACHLKDSL
ncbi:MAG: SCO family protein [Proteobacteria bacterium]|nr:SCO family protein [Pseudomonadota bacterium]MDA1238497.1 SCO family protein [Pseudomonadota bacterium]